MIKRKSNVTACVCAQSTVFTLISMFNALTDVVLCVCVCSEALGHENPVFLGGSPQTKTRTVSQIMTRQSSETGRHLLSEPGTPLSPPAHGDVFFPIEGRTRQGLNAHWKITAAEPPKHKELCWRQSLTFQSSLAVQQLYFPPFIAQQISSENTYFKMFSHYGKGGCNEMSFFFF